MPKPHGIAWLNYLPGYQGETWNPVIGCSWASPGCDHCYAHALHDMRHDAYTEGKRVPACYSAPFGTVRYLPERLAHPLHWRAPRMIFVNSMGDLFHPDVPTNVIEAVVGAMSLCGQHQFVILTKRAEAMRRFFAERTLSECQAQLPFESLDLDSRIRNVSAINGAGNNAWPLPNVWLGVTAENQEQWDARVPLLVQTPAARRLVSIEPMLGPINLMNTGQMCGNVLVRTDRYPNTLDWVICGGESGSWHDIDIRPMHLHWARSVRDQCNAAGVPFFFKQWGNYPQRDIDPTQQYPHLACIDDLGGAAAISGKPGDWAKMSSTDMYWHDVPEIPAGWTEHIYLKGEKNGGDFLDGAQWHQMPEVIR